MNEKLLERLNIDRNMNIDDLIEALGEKQFEYIEREQSASDEARKAELAKIIKDIDNEIEELKEKKRTLSSSIILDNTENTDFPTKSPVKKEEPREDYSEKIAEIKKKDAEKTAINTDKAAPVPESTPSQQKSGSQSKPSFTFNKKAPLSDSTMYDAKIFIRNKEYDKAFPICQKFSEKGDALAQYFLSLMYNSGNGTAADHDRAAFWLKKSAENGCPEAQLDHGKALVKNAGYDNSLLKEGLKYIGLAAESSSRCSLEALKEYVNTVLNRSPDKKALNTAMSYCNTIIEKSEDSYEKDLYENNKKKLKNMKKASRSSSSCGGSCFVSLLQLLAVGVVICIIGWAINNYSEKKEKQNREQQAASDTVSAEIVTEAALGERIIELHELEPIEEQCLTISSDKGYTTDNSIWDGAFVYRAGNGHDTAYAIYQIDGLFEKITFEATPWLGNGVFFKSSSADIMIVNAETNDIIYTQTIGYESGVVEIEADISGVNMLGIYVKKTSSGLGDLAYTFIRNVYIYPAGQAPENEGHSNETVYFISGNIRAGAGTEYDAILISDGTKEFIATGNSAAASDGSTWYEIYTDESRSQTGWCHSSIAVKK